MTPGLIGFSKVASGQLPVNRGHAYDHRFGLQSLSQRGNATTTASPGVAECAWIGLPDEKTGEAVTLFVAKAPGELRDLA